MAKTDRIEIMYGLTFTTPFHCGAGSSAGFMNRVVIRDAGGALYVPGSTVKGVLRRHCEQLARVYTDEDAGRLEEGSARATQWSDESLYDPVMMIAQIFGSRSRPGSLFFDDARQLAEVVSGSELGRERARSAQTESYAQMRLERRTRTALRDASSISECGLKGLTFYGRIDGWLQSTTVADVEGEPGDSLLLLLAGLCLLDQLGGNKSIGKGQCICEITELFVNKIEYTQMLWQSWLERVDRFMYRPKNVVQGEEGE